MDQLYTSLGIIHLFALSGMQVGFFINGIRKALLRLGILQETVDIWMLPISLIYAGLTGFSVSVVRSLLQKILSQKGIRGMENMAMTLMLLMILMPKFLLTAGGVLSCAYAFILTTLIPIGLMLLVNLIFITRKLRMSPLKFLRRDLSRSRNKKAVKLPNVSFISRFRLRIFLRNKGNYLVLLLGLLLANILMIYGMSIKGILNDYMDKTQESMPSSYQTVFKGPIRKEVEERLKDSLSKKDKNIFDHPSYDYQNKLVGGKVDTNLFTLYQVKIRGKKVDDQTRASIYGTDLDGSYVKDGLKRNNIKNISTRSSEGKTYDVYVTEGIK
ncbi:MAG: ComEC/Rec2 family competence protein, partial [Peptostreptococcus sp.]|nr:ComEC/Rec2 family competence protein [Peptostreptococcus sp.]